MRLLYVAFLFSLFIGTSILWIEIIMKLIDNMNKVHVAFCIPIPVVLIIWYLCSGLCFTAINQQFKKIKLNKLNNNEKK